MGGGNVRENEPMSDTLDDLAAFPDLDLGDLPDLGDLGLREVPPPDLPTADATSLADLAERYRPTTDLVEPTGKGRRPPRWDDPQVLTMLGNLEGGAYRRDAVVAAGLAERTVARWVEMGKAEEEENAPGPMTFYRHIWQAITRAEGVPHMRALQVIHRAAAGRGGWRAAAWFLERRYPDEWGPRGTAWEREREREAAPTVEEVDAKLMRMISEVKREM